MADLALANSTYATGTSDTVSTLVNNVTATDAQQYNGVASGVIQIETILGNGPGLKGTVADLNTRLNVALATNGTLNSGLVIPSPVINGTITGTGLTGTALVGPAITGTVSGGATYTGITITGNTIGTGALKTATGSATGSVTSSGAGSPATTVVAITMNDYAFFPSHSYTHNGDTGEMRLWGQNVVDPATTVARESIYLYIFSAVGARTTTGVVRWRYFTASDNPVMWVAYDPETGKITSTWASDDPTPDDTPGVVAPNTRTLRLTAQDLESFTALTPVADFARTAIRDAGLNMQHQAYRALQLHARDAAPAGWLLTHCRVNTETGKLCCV